MKWATAIRDGFKVPMIGIPEISILETCDLCGVEHDLQHIRFTGRQMLCDKCLFEHPCPSVSIRG